VLSLLAQETAKKERLARALEAVLQHADEMTALSSPTGPGLRRLVERALGVTKPPAAAIDQVRGATQAPPERKATP